MNILFLMISFPDIRKDSNLYTDLANEFKNNGHDVYVVTMAEKKLNQSTKFENEGELKVLRVKTGNLFGINFIQKGITTLRIPGLYIKAIKKYLSEIKFDLAIYPTPPITLAPVVEFVKRRDSCKSYLILRDIFPQNAKDLGMIRNDLIFKYFRKKEQKLYEVSDYIGCLSQGNIDYVVKNNRINPSKLELLYNWKKENYFENENLYKKKYDLENKFVAVFGGNIGYAQELEFLLELAKIYKDREDIIFLIIGNGVKRPKIENIVKSENLKNVIIMNSLPREEYDHLIRECDVGLVNLNRNFTIPNFPSKSTDYFEAGIPVLASTDKNTDFGKLIEETKSGLWSETGNLKNYQNNFEKLLNNELLRKKIGENGRKFFEENMKIQITYRTIIKHF